MKDKFKLIVSLVAIITIIVIGVGFSQQTPPRLPTVMAECSGEDVEVTFNIPLAGALKVLGFSVENSIIKDTGTAVIYIPTIDVYYVTKRDQESRRYDGEIFSYIKSECLK
jgi:hypothetical protein